LSSDFNGIIAQLVANPGTFLNNVKSTVVKGFEDFFKALPTELPKKMFDWVKELAPNLTLPNLDFSGVTSFVLQMFELDWDSIQGKLINAVGGPENVAMVTKAYTFIEGFIKDPNGIFNMVQANIEKVSRPKF